MRHTQRLHHDGISRHRGHRSWVDIGDWQFNYTTKLTRDYPSWAVRSDRSLRRYHGAPKEQAIFKAALW